MIYYPDIRLLDNKLSR